MNPDDKLAIAAAELAVTSPDAWNAFMAALTDKNEQLRTICIMSPLDKLPTHQGRAQNMHELLGDLANCVDRRNEIQRKSRK